MIRTPHQIGPFRLVRELDHGGQGLAFVAVDERLDRHVFLKVLPADHDDLEQIERFRQEAAIAARLDHPGLCTVHEVGIDHGQHYIAMQLVEGETLAERLERAGGTTRGARGAARSIPDVVPTKATREELRSGGDAARLRRTLRLFERTARSLHMLHEQGINHRDLKPTNIMVTPSGWPVLLDLGAASEDGVETSSRRTRLGTPAYMAPEQVEAGRRVDRRADVHALGAILFECLTRRPAFRAATRDGLYRAILLEEPPDPRRLVRGLPKDLCTIIASALAKNPEERIPTALCFAEELSRVRRHQPIRTRRPTALRRLSSWAAREPALARAVGTLMLVMFLALVVTSLLLVRREAVRRIVEADVLRHDDAHAMTALLEAFDREHWPALPASVPDMDRWLSSAEDLFTRLPDHLSSNVPAPAEVARDSRAEPTLSTIRAGLPKLRRARDELRIRRAAALEINTRTVDRHLGLWNRTIADIAADPRYGRLTIPPQAGLVPVGRDPGSGLHEFAHLGSGALPRRDPRTGRLEIDGSTGIVLVLVPGGTFLMGAEADGPPGSPNIDASAHLAEAPRTFVQLDPYFISKFEMTQAQWRRASGASPRGGFHGVEPLLVEWDDPSSSGSGHGREPAHVAMRPVETVSWWEAARVLGTLGLELPTEAQWECAARGGTTGIRWSGADRRSLEHAENIGETYQASSRGHADVRHAADRFVYTASVGSLRANPFGLHDVLGNVSELVRDQWGSYTRTPRTGDGLRDPGHGRLRVARGAHYGSSARHARSAMRIEFPAEARWPSVGVRPARVLTGPP